MATTVSVLTPSYQYARFLPDALDSTAAQSDLAEHVVVDGASSDGTVELLAARADDRLVWRSEPDDGQSAALNHALALATGEWIGWLNADEFYLPGALSAVVDAAARTDADVVVGDAVFVDTSGRFLRLFSHHRYSRRVLRNYGCYLLSSSVFIRRSRLLDEPWDRALRHIMDWDLFLRLDAEGARFASVSRPLSAFRVHDEQVTAAPITRHSGEHRRVRARYGITYRERSHAAGRLEHVLLRTVSGRYVAEWRARRRFAGRDMRWFTGHSGPAARQLVCAGAS